MDMFKGQGSDDLREFWAKNDCEIVIIPHNLFSRFKPLDLSVNKAAKAYVSEMYNTWMVNEISKQLKEDIAPADVKVSLVLFVIKTLHVKRIVDLYHHKKADKQIIVNSVRAAGKSEAIEKDQYITEKVKNPFNKL